MLETFVALLLGHVLADFVLQTNTMVQRKSEPLVFAAHIFFVWASAAALLGQPFAWELVALAGAHALIDVVKLRFKPSLAAFLIDQAAHLATLGAVSAIAPELWATGPFASFQALPAAMSLLAGLLIATRVGSFAIALLMAPYTNVAAREGLNRGGALIGLLERGITFVLILINAPTAIGFVIAAKSILRFRDEGGPEITEYVIIGTLASFGWALVATMVTQALLTGLPPVSWFD